MAPDNSNASEGGNRRLLQSIGLLVCSCLSVAVASCFAVKALGGGDTQPVYAQERVNPNTAPVGSLIRLPGIGLTRARAIEAHRDAVRQKAGTSAAFRCSDDLQQIRGIGPKTADDIAAWLEFESLASEDVVRPEDGRTRP
jgi:hypothetical protein